MRGKAVNLNPGVHYFGATSSFAIQHFDEPYRGHRIDARCARQAELARRVKRERLIDPQLRTFRFPIPLPSSPLFREQEDDQAIL